MSAELETADREAVKHLVAAAGLLLVGAGLIYAGWNYYWTLSSVEQSLVGHWVYAPSPDSAVLSLSSDRTWSLDPRQSQSRSGAISCHIGPREGRWRVSAGYLVREAGREQDVDAVSVVGPNEITIGMFPYHRIVVRSP